ncbi:MAG: hypothetical protein ACREHD_10105 [Pirellulales bacterium]
MKRYMAPYIAGLLLFFFGWRAYDQRSEAEERKASENEKDILVIARPDFGDAIDEDKSFVHQHTGVKLCFPPGWNVGQADVRRAVADIGLSKGNVAVMVVWGRTHASDDSEAAMLAKDLAERKEIYGKRVSEYECVQVGEKAGYRFTVSPPIIGFSDPNARRVVYLFYVDSLPSVAEDSPFHGKYTIAVYGTGRERDLEGVNEVLHCLRWK